MTTPSPGGETGVVCVLGVELSRDEVCREAQYHPAPSFDAARDSAARALAVRALLVREARREGLLGAGPSSESDISNALERLVARAVPVPLVSREECRAFYESNTERLRTPELREISHILFADDRGAGGESPSERAEGSDAADASAAETRASEVLAELRRRPDRFEALARSSSACPSGSRGGSLGQLRRGEVDPEIERACDALAPGEIADSLVFTRHGLHIVRLDASAPGRIPPFESVRRRIEIYLRDAAWRRALHTWLEGLSRTA